MSEQLPKKALFIPSPSPSSVAAAKLSQEQVSGKPPVAPLPVVSLVNKTKPVITVSHEEPKSPAGRVRADDWIPSVHGAVATGGSSVILDGEPLELRDEPESEEERIAEELAVFEAVICYDESTYPDQEKLETIREGACDLDFSTIGFLTACGGKEAVYFYHLLTYLLHFHDEYDRRYERALEIVTQRIIFNWENLPEASRLTLTNKADYVLMDSNSTDRKIVRFIPEAVIAARAIVDFNEMRRKAATGHSEYANVGNDV
jgi:hypothetical protein